jgi:hypothetical protein
MERFQVYKSDHEGEARWCWRLLDSGGALVEACRREDGFPTLSKLRNFHKKKHPDAEIEGIGEDEPEG